MATAAHVSAYLFQIGVLIGSIPRYPVLGGQDIASELVTDIPGSTDTYFPRGTITNLLACHQRGVSWIRRALADCSFATHTG